MTAKKITPAAFVKYAVLLFGRRWKGDMSKASGISREQLWRYAEEITPISDEQSDKLKTTLRKGFEKQRATAEAAIKSLA